jgi:hypothetical protein
MIMDDKLVAALLYANASTDELRGYGATDVEAMRNAVESGEISWDREPGSSWAEITQDARKAAIVTFASTPYGVLVLDNN